jgi:hypothetical protein
MAAILGSMDWVLDLLIQRIQDFGTRRGRILTKLKTASLH